MKPYYDHAGITIYQGHVLDVLPQLPAEPIQCCISSPPYWGLRDYNLPPQIWDDPGGCEHEWGDEKLITTGRNDGDNERDGRQIGGVRVPKQEGSQGQFCQLCGAWRGSLGLEPDPSLYIQHIVQVFREVKRVLRKDGTLWLNLGDSYSSTAGGGTCIPTKVYKQSLPYAEHTAKIKSGEYPQLKTGLKPKDLCGIPWRVALALQSDGWWLRSDIIWSKPNPMPESCTDRPTRAHEYVFLLTKSAKYFYDADAVREAHQQDTINRKDNWGRKKEPRLGADKFTYQTKEVYLNPAGRNLRSVWTIATEPTPEAHFATFPEKLVIPCIKAGTSEKGCCPECGAPWVRVVEKSGGSTGKGWTDHKADLQAGMSQPGKAEAEKLGGEYKVKTIGWKPSCVCGTEHPIPQEDLDADPTLLDDFEIEPYSPIPCTVLDPFSGSGKALIVAQKFGRKGIGIELKAEYCEMPLKKIAQNRMF